MRSKLGILFLIICASVLSACSEPRSSSAAVQNDSEQRLQQGPDIAAASVERVAHTQSDGSEIVTTRDQMGNEIETRIFKSNTYLDKVIVKTLLDGSKIGTAYRKDGTALRLADRQVALAMGVEGDELAQIIGLAPVHDEPARSVTVDEPLAAPQIEESASVPQSAPIPQSVDRTYFEEQQIARSAVSETAKAESNSSLQAELNQIALNIPK